MELRRAPATATVVVFPIVDADGDTVTGAASLDSEWVAWSDAAGPSAAGNPGFQDCTNEATELGTTGIYALTLTTGELPTASPYVYVRVQTGTAGAKTQHILINTGNDRADLRTIAGTAVSTTTAQLGVNVVQLSADATAADNAEAFFDGTGYAGTGNTIPTVTSAGLSAAAVDAILDDAVDGTTTLRQLLRGFASALLGKLSGAATTTIAIRDLADSKDRITATVDANGNRSAVTLDLT